MKTLNKQNYASINYSRRSRKSKKSQENFAKKIILGIIIFTAIIILGLTIFAAIFTNENRVKSAISNIATDYYENYFYENLLRSPDFPKDHPEDVLEEYQSSGLSVLTLRDLLLYDDQKHFSERDFLTKFCDEGKTYIHFYPDEPYTRNSYHVEYTYSCNF